MFVDHNAFYELVTMATRAFDEAWHTAGARVEDFSGIAEDVEQRVQRWLTFGASSVDALRDAIDAELQVT